MWVGRENVFNLQLFVVGPAPAIFPFYYSSPLPVHFAQRENEDIYFVRIVELEFAFSRNVNAIYNRKLFLGETVSF